MSQSSFTRVAMMAAWATSIPATQRMMPAFDSAISPAASSERPVDFSLGSQDEFYYYKKEERGTYDETV